MNAPEDFWLIRPEDPAPEPDRRLIVAAVWAHPARRVSDKIDDEARALAEIMDPDGRPFGMIC
jgi:hypothetical protein